jgi:hypothetical protein
MTDLPILLSAPMIRAILAGNKTQTRRLATSLLTKCVPGDRLLVRESWQVWKEFDKVKAEDISAEAKLNINYPASYSGWDAKIRPSIHMPLWASRITLTVTERKIQYLQDITDDDAIAEGVVPVLDGYGHNNRKWWGLPGEYNMMINDNYPIGVFKKLWDSIHKKPEEQWDASPHVVALGFSMVVSR